MPANTRLQLVSMKTGHMDTELERTKQLKLEGDHIGICRFSRCESDRSAFRLVSDGLKFLIEQSPKALGPLHDITPPLI